MQSGGTEIAIAGKVTAVTGNNPMKKHKYEKHLQELAVELVELQRWLIHSGKRVVALFEGRDAAGKGGTIKAISEYLDTRHYRIVALGKPTERESTQWYFQRYIEHLPAAGEIVLFDRSWYNRAGVEHVMGFCSNAEYRQFLMQCPQFERNLVDDGILLFKYWLAVDQVEQEVRFAERAENPLKRWKISPIDLAARNQYQAYAEARDAMLQHTHTDFAPWFVADFNDQHRGRLNLIRHLLDHLPNRKVLVKPLKLPKLKGDLGVEELPDKSLWVKETF
jgi:polyphosphate kinase 2